MSEKFRPRLESIPNPKIEKGSLVKLRDDLLPESYEAFQDSDVHQGIAYRVLHVEVDEDGDTLAWIGPDIFSPKEIEDFDSKTALDEQNIDIYGDVMPAPIENLQLLLQ